ncbi:MAG: PQQ-binding-like beta-propeller repeat protein, partial [Armatimonadetes bacterium]|nr:PQQ-binding-like beta-propeller repeat protein [Armatimonadota bacterium]
MKQYLHFVVVGAAASLGCFVTMRSSRDRAPFQHTSDSRVNSGASNPTGLRAKYARLPLSFEANEGQVDQKVKFVTRGKGYSLFLTDKAEAVLSLSNGRTGERKRGRMGVGHPPLARSPTHPLRSPPSPPLPHSSVIRLKLVGATPNPQVRGADKLPGKVNYFLGNDPKKWRTNVATYQKVEYESVYPGVDLVYYGNQSGRLEHDFIVSPGADPKQIAFVVGQQIPLCQRDVSHSLTGRETRNKAEKDFSPYVNYVNRDGDLMIHTSGGDLEFHKPIAYQDTPKGRKEISARYALLPQSQIKNPKSKFGFVVGSYDPSLPLIIDPVLVYSTYLGGSGDDVGRGIAVDTSGNAYVTGIASTSFPTANALDSSHGGGTYDVFVAKLNVSGSQLVYSTFLGGGSDDKGADIAVDGAGNVYVTGDTFSNNFPTVNAYQATYAGSDVNVFLTKLNAAGSAILYSTYLRGALGANTGGIALDGSGKVYVTGGTTSTDFPTRNAYQSAKSNGADAFVAKIDPSASGDASLIYSTYLGGSGDETGHGIAIDSSGSAYVVGESSANDFPTVNPLPSGRGGLNDCFVTKFSPAGSALVYSTYLGGSNQENGLDIAVDSSGSAYVTGNAYSSDFPTTPNAFQQTYGGGPTDAIVAKLSASGSSLVYSTYLGGSDSDRGGSIAVDSYGNAYLTGATSSPNFPMANALQPTQGSDASDAFVAKLNPAGTALSFSTYHGGNAHDNNTFFGGIALDSSANIYVTGHTYSTNSPTTNPLQAANAGGSDAFIAKITESNPPSSSVTVPSNGGSYSTLTTISGMASDGGGSGVKKVDISIKRNEDGNYWNGSAWVGTGEAWLPTTDTTHWYYNSSAVTWEVTKQYTVRSRAEDNLGNVETPGAGNTFTFVSSGGGGGAGGRGDWWMFHHDPQHTGRSPFTGPTTPGQKWRYFTGNTVAASPAVGSDGTVYIPSNDGNLYAFNADGTVKWTFPYGAGAYSESTPAVGSDGTIFFGTGSNGQKIFAVNPDGTKKWEFTTGAEVVSSPVVASDGSIYIGSHDGKVYAFNTDGAQKTGWPFATGAAVSSSPVIGADGTIYVGSYDRRLYALNPDGTKIWDYLTDERIKSSPAVASDGSLYFGTLGTKVYGLTAGGALKSGWPFTTGGGVQSSPAISFDGTVYIGCDDGKLYALNADGTKKWDYNAGAQVISSPAIDGAGIIYVGCANTKVYAVDPSNGTKKWEFATAGVIQSSPAIGPEGVIYIGSNDGGFYAIRQATLTLTSPNGGERWQRGVAKEITWTHNDADPNVMVKIELLKGGAVESTIVDSTPNDGSYTWSNPSNQALGTDCKIRITSTTDAGFTDTSDADFEIWGYTSPGNGGRGDWWMFHHDPQHTGRSPFAGPSTPAKKWEFVTGGIVGTSPAVAADGTIYLGSEDGKVYATNPDGTKKWEFQTGGAIERSSPTVGADGTVYIGSDDGKLYALNPSGPDAERKKWEFTTGGYVYSSPAIAGDGTVYVGSCQSGKVYALNSDGTEKWEFATGGWVACSPAVGTDGTVYVGSNDGKLYALNPGGPDAGRKQWEFATGSAGLYSAPAVGTDGSIYFGTWSGKVYALAPNGTAKWDYTTGGQVNSSPAVGADGTVYIGSEDFKVYAFDPNGGKKWEFATGGWVNCSPAVGADGTIYIGSEDTKVYALNSDGSNKWQFASGGGVRWSSPAIGADGTMYVGSMDNKLYALTQATLALTSPNGGERWQRGVAKDITWTHNAADPNVMVKIELLKGGQPAQELDPDGEIVASTENDGSYIWCIPPGLTPATDYRIRITSTTDGAFTDASDANFEIYPLTVDFTPPDPADPVEGQTVTITVQLTDGYGGTSVGCVDVTVPFAVDPASTAKDPDDYALTPSSPITIPAGQTSKTITITTAQDTLDEDNETVKVVMGTPTNADAGVANSQTATITDNDAATATLSINDVTVTEGDTGTTTATFTVTLTGATGQVVTVGYATADGTATAGGDYNSATGTLTFNPGDTTKTATVAV